MSELLVDSAGRLACTAESSGLRVRDLRTALLRPVNLALPETGVIGVCGPSGAGKSALLAALAGLAPARGDVRGEVSWRGARWAGGSYSLPLHRRPLSLGFQDARLFANCSVTQNLQLARRYRKRALSEAWFERLLCALQLRPLLSRPVELLSGGEAQRVALLRQLICNAPVQLFDEPLSAVDVPLRIGAIIPILKQFWREHPALVLWVSHDSAELQLLADRLLEVRSGEVREWRHPAVLFDTWYREETAGCASAQFQLQLTVREWLDEHRLLLLNFHGHTLYADRCAGKYRPGEGVRALLSAGDISLCRERPDNSSLLNYLPVRLSQMSELQDGRMRLTLQCAAQQLCADISKYSCKKLQLQPGQSLFAQFKAGALLGL